MTYLTANGNQFEDCEGIPEEEKDWQVVQLKNKGQEKQELQDLKERLISLNDKKKEEAERVTD
jgi:hypothetical protein